MMRPSFIHMLLAVAAMTLGSAPLCAAVDETGPRLEHYASYDEFLRAKVAWESRPAASSTKADMPEQAATQPTTRPIPVPEGVDPASETAPPPLAITGPEDLDVAVELAKGINHPNYTAAIRYHRSTHLSFPLHSIDGSDMSQASVPNALQVGKKATSASKPLDAVDQQLSLEQLSKQNEIPKVGGPEALSGINIDPGNAPIRIMVESQY